MTMNNDAPRRRVGWLQRITVGRNPKVTLIRIAVLIVFCFVFFHYILLPFRVEGISMEPTFHNHAVRFINRLVYRFHEPQRGDVVAISTSDIDVMYMKRIVALPGEMIGFHRGHVVVNGREFEEPYVKKISNWEIPAELLKPGEYYCVGDNREMPERDHYKGRAERERIVGRVIR
jgi:signal peptidase I